MCIRDRDIAGSDKSYPFHYEGNGNQLFVFEAPIDLLSFICLLYTSLSSMEISLKKVLGYSFYERHKRFISVNLIENIARCV